MGYDEGNSAMMSLTRSQAESLPITPIFCSLATGLESHYAFATPAIACISSGTSRYSPFSYIPPTSYITKTLRRFPPAPLILLLHHRDLSILSPSLKIILRDLPPFLLPISHQSYLTEQYTICLQASQQPATWL